MILIHGISNFLFVFFQINGGNIVIHTVQSDSDNMSTFFLNFIKKCRNIQLSDYQAVGLSIYTQISQTN